MKRSSIEPRRYASGEWPSFSVERTILDSAFWPIDSPDLARPQLMGVLPGFGNVVGSTS